jgi:hypothetical protein
VGGWWNAPAAELVKMTIHLLQPQLFMALRIRYGYNALHNIKQFIFIKALFRELLSGKTSP